MYPRVPREALFPSFSIWSGMGLSNLMSAAADTPAPDVADERFMSLASVGLDTWALGSQHWRYLSSSGYGLTLGNTAAGLPAWERSVPLAGVGLARTLPSGRLAPGGWDYALAAGALETQTTRSLAEGDLAYGPMAADASVRYAVDPNLTLGSRLQGTNGLTALGLEGAYALTDLGTWRVGVSGSRQAWDIGLRSRVAYTLGLWPGLDLSWAHVRQGSRYADLASLGGDSACACVSNQWQLDLAANRWGRFSGSFEQQTRLNGAQEQRLGLAHHMVYGPYLRVQLETSRNLASGDYGWGARLSVPLW